MTSNIGSSEILSGHQENVDQILHSTFKPEFLNRIDEIVYFNSLNKEVQYKVVDKMLNDLKSRLLNEYYVVDFKDSVKDYVLENAYSPEFGARPLKRYIQHNIETELAKRIISGELKTGKKYIVDYNNENGIIIKLDE